MKKNIGYCGLDCEKCDAFLATVRNDDALRERRQRCGAGSTEWRSCPK